MKSFNLMRYFVLLMLMVGFASGVDIDFDCPDEIFVDEEFECSLEVFDGSGVYDVKVEVDTERDSVLKIWDEDEDEWLSGYYYLKEFVENGEESDVRIKVSDDGDYDGVVKLRQGDKREFFDIELEVLEGEEVESDDGSARGVPSEVGTSGEVPSLSGKIVEEEIIVKKQNGVISLNGASVDSSDVIYISKEARVMDYLVYGFVIFLIFVIGVLIWDRGF
jgi:hypothetical protein